MKRGKSENNKFAEKIIIAGVILLIIFSLAVLVKALTDEETQTLQDELNNLTQYLNDNNYGWLTDYNVSYPFIEVYEFNQARLIATFPQISSEGLYKIFLTNLSSEENYSQDVFDLRVKGGSLEFDWIVDPTYYRDIPWGYNLLNDSLNLGTIGAIWSSPSDANVVNVGNNRFDVWAYEGTLPLNVTFNFTNTYSFDSIDVFPYPQASSTYSINETIVYVSDDAVTWTDVTGRSALWGGIAPTFGQYYTIHFPEQRKKYVKLEIFNFIAQTTGGSSEIRVYKNTTNLARNLTGISTVVSATSGGDINETRDGIAGDVNNYWQGTAPANITYDFGSAKRVSFIVVSAYVSACGVANSSILVSDDNVTWTEVANNLDANSSNYESYVFNFTEQNKRYLQYRIETHGGGIC